MTDTPTPLDLYPAWFRDCIDQRIKSGLSQLHADQCQRQRVTDLEFKYATAKLDLMRMRVALEKILTETTEASDAESGYAASLYDIHDLAEAALTPPPKEQQT